MTNSSTKTKCKANLTATTKGSVYSKWTSFTKLEVLRYITVINAIIIQPRPKIMDRFEAIRDTMLYTLDETEQKEKGKTEVFSNLLVKHFQK